MLYLGIKGELPDLAHHTIYLSKDYRRNVQEIEDGLVPPGRALVLRAERLRHRPGAGAARLFDTLYAGAGRPPHRRRHRLGGGAGEVPRLALRNGWSGWACTIIEKRIVFEKVMTPTDWEADLNVFRGATFNLAHSLRQMLHFRPRNRFEDLDGVYLVGGGTHPGSGLPVIFESARITSRLLADDLGLSRTGAVADGGARL